MAEIVTPPTDNGEVPRRDDVSWMHEMFVEAERRYAELPAWARPVVTPPPGAHARSCAPPTPDYRTRCLLALSLVNQRGTDTGLSWADTNAVKAALDGAWDRPGEVG